MGRLWAVPFLALITSAFVLVATLFVANIPVQAVGEPGIPGVALSLAAEVTDGNAGPEAHPAGSFRRVAFMPFVEKRDPQPVIQPLACQSIPGESYGILDVIPPPTDRPAEQHADLNLALRSYALTTAYKGLVSYGGTSDGWAPQLPGLFGDNRTPVFSAVYRVYDWDWTCNCRGNLIASWPATLAGLAVAPGEIIHVPESGYSIGSGYEVVVLYASNNRITLKYTRSDNVVSGYTLHIENVCVDPSLLALYQSWNASGRSYLPALRAGQGIGRAGSNEIGVAIRDTGTFMDPRSLNDWWRGR